VDPG